MSPDGPTSQPPEERLLHLIRKQTRPAPAREVVSTASEPARAVAPRVVRGVTIPWQIIIGWILGMMLVAEIVYLALIALQPLPPLEIPTRGATDIAPAIATTLNDLPSLAATAAPNLFEAQGGQGSASAPVKPSGGMPSAAGNQMASRLTLMGIVSGASPQAIIEDSQTKKTYFVTAGQPVVEGAVLEQVLDNRVVLDFNGEKIELSL